MMAQLFHIVVRIKSRNEHPGALVEERVYTVFGKAAAWRKFHWLVERWPTRVSEPVAIGADVREPITG